jgi:hypothetical protein
MSNYEAVEVQPDVARVSEGLRDTGYEFNTAMADIIDNSITAKATKIDILVNFDFLGEIVLCVVDNGCGMDREGLKNAMRYGSDRRADPASLGKFGLGLKTASTAFCKKLSLISRATANDVLLKATWDLERIAQSGKWLLEISDTSQDEKDLLDDTAKGSSGTLVLWENIDRFLAEYTDRKSKSSMKALDRILKLLTDHIATVYQRFLDPSDDRAENIEIRLNGALIDSWDPFCIKETKEPQLEKNIPIQLPNNQQSSVSVRAFILPRKEEFSSSENRMAAKISNERQGVYVYRENRLIHGPDWLGMFKQEPHSSLLRVELSFDHNLDDAFQVDIKKSRILLNESLFEYLRDTLLSGPRREADIRYRKGVAATAKGASALLHVSSSNTINQKLSVMKTAKVKSIDENNKEVVVHNNSGVSKAKIKILATEDKSLVISTESTLDNGVLWEAALINGEDGVLLNAGHPYYAKAYLPNKENSVVVQALDYLLWSLAQAEFNNVNDENVDAFEEFRIEVSRNLKRLVSDLPDHVEE